MLIERRLLLRYLVNFPVCLTTISTSGDVKLAAEAVDLSLGGVGINCGPEVMASLQEQSQFPITCRVSFSLPDSEHSVSSLCRLLASRRLSQDCYHLSFKFTTFEGESEERLTEFFN